MSDDTPNLERQMEKEVGREADSHGANWAAQCGGYFSDPKRAEPFLVEVETVAQDACPDVLVDLGGGTGFILRLLLERGRLPAATRLVDMDLSETQLAAVKDPRIQTRQGSFMDFQRADVVRGNERLLLMTRSTLHYAGLAGQEPLLRHVRAQLQPGEFFIHQSLCAADPESALVVNELFERVHSDKWIPPRASFLELCARAGFRMVRVASAPYLSFEEKAMSKRYHVPPDEMARIRRILQEEYKDVAGWTVTHDGFILTQMYNIFICEAVG